MRIAIRNVLVVACGVVALLASEVTRLAAEDQAPPASGAAGTVQSQQGADADMAGCPGKKNGGSCCATCQDRQKQGAPVQESAGGGCPCQRAKRLKQGS